MKNLKIEFCNFELEYTNKDKEYIDNVIQILNDKSEEVMNFFELKNLSRKVKIKFWDNVEEYRNFFNKSLKKYNKMIPDWEVARATNTLNECRIDILSLGEARKCRGHANDSVENLIQIIVHEFVHICHFEYNNHTSTMTWFMEALATNLAGQNNCKKLTCTLQEIVTEMPTNYGNYYLLGKYLLENYDKSQVLELAKNKELLEKSTEDIYNNTLKSIGE